MQNNEQKYAQNKKKNKLNKELKLIKQATQSVII